MQAWASGPGRIGLEFQGAEGANDAGVGETLLFLVDPPISRLQRFQDSWILTWGDAPGFNISRVWR